MKESACAPGGETCEHGKTHETSADILHLIAESSRVGMVALKRLVRASFAQWGSVWLPFSQDARVSPELVAV